jgi:hypothetical protein
VTEKGGPVDVTLGYTLTLRLNEILFLLQRENPL